LREQLPVNYKESGNEENDSQHWKLAETVAGGGSIRPRIDRT
jgi:hypothetical protein